MLRNCIPNTLHMQWSQCAHTVLWFAFDRSPGIVRNTHTHTYFFFLIVFFFFFRITIYRAFIWISLGFVDSVDAFYHVHFKI